jgi:4-amino-4-deoxy-L-arabinose transferase-like glycosyltransferase
VLLCATVYLPGIGSIPPIDRDESRFAQASRQMFEAFSLPPDRLDERLHAGGLVLPMLGEQPRLNKPPLIYWLQAGAAWILTAGEPARDGIWMYRLPSLLAAIALVLVTWRLGAGMFDARAAWLGGALLAVCPLIVFEAHQARADLVMTLFTTASTAGLWSVWRRAGRDGRRPARWTAVAALWLGLGLGMLAKGPVPLLVVAATAIALSAVSRRWSWLARTCPALGAVLLALVLLPWPILVASRVGWDALAGTFHREVILRAGSPREGHWGPPGYHLVLLAPLLWPGSLLVAGSVMRALRRGVRPPRATLTRSPEAFLLAWLVPSWLILELVATKLPHYTMPVYPALALLAGRGVLGAASGAWKPGRVQRAGTALWLGITAVIGLGIPVATFAVGVQHSEWIYALAPCWIAGLALFGVLARRAFSGPQPGRWLTLHVAGVILAAGTWVFSLGALLPGAKRLFVADRLMGVLEAIDPASERALASIGYHEPSLVFATRARVRLIERSGEGQWWRDEPQGLLIIPRRDVLRLHVVLGGTEGFNYSSGQWVELAIVRPFHIPADPEPGP